MKNNIVIILLVTVFTLMSCAEDEKDFLLLAPEKHDISQKIEFIPFEEDSIGKPENLLALGDWIIVVEPSSYDGMLNIYNEKTHTYHRLLKKGNAGNEVLNVSQIGRLNPNAFYIYDNLGNKVFTFSLDQEKDTCMINHILPMDKYYSFSMDDSLVVGCLKQGGRYAASNLSGNYFGKIGNYEEYGLPEHVGSALLQGMTTMNPDKKRLAWFSFYAVDYSILSYKDSIHLEILHEKLFRKPEFEVTEGTPFFLPSSIFGFTSVTSSTENIYVLYNGTSLADFMKRREEALLSNNICVIDWNGSFLRSLHSLQPFRCISYNQDKKRLYGIFYTEEDGYKVGCLDC
ncbi:BF3164 family lipoprotein [uncultured Phocaeicola sp.]|uniref:6-bladed beta-propeller n=1 Tax=Candidatus Gallipaludibacter merdavium TaxID=2840839 RepID=A0A9D9N3L4_9BACT|nr:BF3164 family lipoprotein [uncultured Phocaeicola sp.]MBO8459122.1 hypothetical protein [Candidatus Gallipaludibacter merdavium]